MNKKLPTWQNRRTGDAARGRRLDRYLIHEDLLNSLTNYRQWVGTRGISDHSPIYLEVAGSFQKPRAPFKFNSTWLKDTKYLRRKKEKEEHTLGDIENQLTTLMDEQGRGYTYIAAKLHLVVLETQRSRILLDQEETWRVKSRAIWLQAADGNTKFFHKFANGRKSSDTI
eukprot:PITA_06605